MELEVLSFSKYRFLTSSNVSNPGAKGTRRDKAGHTNHYLKAISELNF